MGTVVCGEANALDQWRLTRKCIDTCGGLQRTRLETVQHFQCLQFGKHLSIQFLPSPRTLKRNTSGAATESSG